MSDLEKDKIIIENFDWTQLSLESLNLVQSRISKAISFKKKDLHATESTVKNIGAHRYKASLAKIFPQHRRSLLPEYKKCVFIVSLGSKNFVESKRLEASIQWIQKNFRDCMVLVGDSVYRLTIQIRGEVEENKARLEALNTGEMFIRDRRSLFEQYSDNCQFEFKLASEIEIRSQFNIYYKEFQELYQSNESFQNLVNDFSLTYLNRVRPREREPENNCPRKHFAITYLLEESALFACLAGEGWPVFVYPGSIKTFEEISEGLHPEVPETLKQIIWVSLRLKKRNSTGKNE